MPSRRGYGEGTIRRRDNGTWEARLYLPPGPDGKRQRIALSGRTRQEASNKLAKARAAKAAGEMVGSNRETVGAYLTRWLDETIKPARKPKTYETYHQTVKLHIAPAIGRYRLSALAPEHVERMMAQMRAAGLSERTV